jgi:hypothetical protein
MGSRLCRSLPGLNSGAASGDSMRRSLARSYRRVIAVPQVSGLHHRYERPAARSLRVDAAGCAATVSHSCNSQRKAASTPIPVTGSRVGNRRLLRFTFSFHGSCYNITTPCSGNPTGWSHWCSQCLPGLCPFCVFRRSLYPSGYCPFVRSEVSNPSFTNSI